LRTLAQPPDIPTSHPVFLIRLKSKEILSAISGEFFPQNREQSVETVQYHEGMLTLGTYMPLTNNLLFVSDKHFIPLLPGID